MRPRRMTGVAAADSGVARARGRMKRWVTARSAESGVPLDAGGAVEAGFGIGCKGEAIGDVGGHRITLAFALE